LILVSAHSIVVRRENIPVVIMGCASSGSLGRAGSSRWSGNGRGSGGSSRYRSSGGFAGGGGGGWGGVRVLRGRDSSVVARTSNTRNGNVVSVDLESKVLERIAVPDGPCGVCLGKLEDTRVFGGRAVVLDNTLANLGDVKKAMEEVRCPVGVCGTVRDVVAKHAQAIQRLTDLVGQVTNDSFRGCILSTPVASPACQS
jgi:hypothetical protein